MTAERQPARKWQASGAITAVVLAIAAREGYRAQAYHPIKGDEMTIGYGSTHHEDGSPIRPGETITQERARIMLQSDTDKTATAIAKCLGDVPLYEWEWAAYLSFSYNVGAPSFCKSTIVKKLHQRPPDYPGACAQLLRWTYAQGRVVPGLVNRRKEEYEQCMGGSK